MPFNIWVDLAPDASLEELDRALNDIQFPVLDEIDPAAQLIEAQAEPARRGVLGFLSLGFIASILLTLIGWLVQSTASMQAQSAQLASLRAMGLPQVSVFMYIFVVQSVNALSGVLSGTAIGISATLLYLPLLDFSGGLPPYQVRVAWDEISIVYAIFAAALLLVALMISLLLSREQLATSVKLGNF